MSKSIFGFSANEFFNVKILKIKSKTCDDNVKCCKYIFCFKICTFQLINVVIFCFKIVIILF